MMTDFNSFSFTKSAFVPTLKLLKLYIMPLLLYFTLSFSIEPWRGWNCTFLIVRKTLSRNIIASRPFLRSIMRIKPKLLHSCKDATISPHKLHSSKKYNLFQTLDVGSSYTLQECSKPQQYTTSLLNLNTSKLAIFNPVH